MKHTLTWFSYLNDYAKIEIFSSKKAAQERLEELGDQAPSYFITPTTQDDIEMNELQNGTETVANNKGANTKLANDPEANVKLANDFIRAVGLKDKHSNNVQAIVSACVQRNDTEGTCAIASIIEHKFNGKEKAKERNNLLSALRGALKRSFDKETDPQFWTVKKVNKAWAVVLKDWPDEDEDKALNKAMELVAENMNQEHVFANVLSWVKAVQEQRKSAA